MHPGPRLLLAAVCATLLGPAGAARAGEGDADVRLLRECGVGTDAAAVLDFFRARTLDDARRGRIAELIGRLGHPRFAVRERATKELRGIGEAARPLLRAAAESDDAETARRAQLCLEALDRGPGGSLTVAALRRLEALAPPGAAPVLLDFLPFAEDEWVVGEVFSSLGNLTKRAEEVDPALVAAAGSHEPLRRAAAGFALGRRAEAKYRELARRLLRDAEPAVRLRAALGLAAGGDREAVPALLALLEEPSEPVRAQVEQWLWRLRDEHAPAPPADETPEARKAYRAAWDAWWRDHGTGIDLAKLADAPRLIGLTVGISWNTSRVWECGTDGKERWEIKAQGPMDAQVLPGGRVLIAEAGAKRVAEYDLKGNVVWEMAVDGEPINCERLPDGRTFIGTRNSVLMVTREKKVLFQHQISAEYQHAVRRLKNGHFVGIGASGRAVEIDEAGKEVAAFQLTDPSDRWGDIDGLGNGRYLVTNYGSGFVREVNAKGATLWQAEVPGACGVERLPGGNYLLACPERMVVIDRSGRQLWEARVSGSVRRAHRR